MVPSSVDSLILPLRRRIYAAYYDIKQPIALWEHDHRCVGLIQAWLFVLGCRLSGSVKVNPSGDLKCDGIFGYETLDAVFEFQSRGAPVPIAPLNPDGMVGRATLDMISLLLPPSTIPRLPTTGRSAVYVDKGGMFLPGVLTGP
jgi:hypothetical protein